MRLEMRGKIFIAVVALAALASLATSARAAERITLRNGFEMRCNHHTEVEGRVRLFLNAGEDSYIERLPEDIVSVETVPDPPAPLDLKGTAPTASAKTGADAKLSPAAPPALSSEGSSGT